MGRARVRDSATADSLQTNRTFRILFGTEGGSCIVREMKCASAFGFLCLAFKPKSACNEGETSGIRPRQFRADAAQREAGGWMHQHEGRQLQRCAKRVPTCRCAPACRGGHQSKCARMIMMTIRRLIPAARPLALLWASYFASGEPLRRSSLKLTVLPSPTIVPQKNHIGPRAVEAAAEIPPEATENELGDV